MIRLTDDDFYFDESSYNLSIDCWTTKVGEPKGKKRSEQIKQQILENQKKAKMYDAWSNHTNILELDLELQKENKKLKSVLLKIKKQTTASHNDLCFNGCKGDCIPELIDGLNLEEEEKD